MDVERSRAVRLNPPIDGQTTRGATADMTLEHISDRTAAVAGDIRGDLELARDLGPVLPRPASGSTAELWEALATIAAADVTAARVVEPHLDALAIIAEARADSIPFDLTAVGADASSTWGVFAAEGQGTRLLAQTSAGATSLSGTKPWCSLASRLTHALVTAHTGDGTRALFAIDLRHSGVTTHDERWFARGLTEVPSGPVDFEAVPAIPIGADGWYLRRPGFAWGGLGVAAIWWGAAVGIARSMFDSSRRREPDQIALAHLGAVDVAVETTRAALADAARRIDRGAGQNQADAGSEARLLAARGRAAAAGCAEIALTRSVRSLGPAPLALDALFARQHADLALYLRQHHAERDDASLGSMIVSGRVAPW